MAERRLLHPLRPEHRNHVLSWDFVFDRTVDGRTIKLMVVIYEYTRQCLAVHVARRIRGKDAIDVFADLMDELLNGELFYALREEQVLIEQWPVFYNTELPHSLLGYRPRVPETLWPDQ